MRNDTGPSSSETTETTTPTGSDTTSSSASEDIVYRTEYDGLREDRIKTDDRGEQDAHLTNFVNVTDKVVLHQGGGLGVKIPGNAFTYIHPGDRRYWFTEEQFGKDSGSFYNLPAFKNDYTIGRTDYEEIGQVSLSENGKWLVPNPTGIETTDVQSIECVYVNDDKSYIEGEQVISLYPPEITPSQDGFVIDDGGQSYISTPVWQATWEMTVSGISAEESFRFTVTKPEVGVSIDDVNIEDGNVTAPKLTFTAKNEMPAYDPGITLFAATGVEEEDPTMELLFGTELDSVDGEYVQTLITEETGESRVGKTRTLTMDGRAQWEFPLGDEDIIGAVITVGGQAAAYAEEPLSNFA